MCACVRARESVFVCVRVCVCVCARAKSYRLHQMHLHLTPLPVLSLHQGKVRGFLAPKAGSGRVGKGDGCLLDQGPACLWGGGGKASGVTRTHRKRDHNRKEQSNSPYCLPRAAHGGLCR